VHLLQLVDDCLGRAGRDEDPIDQKAAAELLDGLRRICGFQKLIKASVISLLRAYLVGEVH